MPIHFTPESHICVFVMVQPSNEKKISGKKLKKTFSHFNRDSVVEMLMHNRAPFLTSAAVLLAAQLVASKGAESVLLSATAHEKSG